MLKRQFQNKTMNKRHLLWCFFHFRYLCWLLWETILKSHDMFTLGPRAMSKTFPICRGVKQGCVLAPTLFGTFSSALLAHAFPEEDGIMFHTRSTGGLFNLPQLRAETKTKHVLIREFCMSMMLPYLLTLRCTCKTCVNILLRLAMTSVWPSTWRKQS